MNRIPRRSTILVAAFASYVGSYVALSFFGTYVAAIWDLAPKVPRVVAYGWEPFGLHDPATGEWRAMPAFFYLPLIAADNRFWHDHDHPHADDPRLPAVPPHFGARATGWSPVPMSLWLLVPAALLCSLFCARLGVERGQALTGGIWPGWLGFAALLLVAGWVPALTSEPAAVAIPAFGWLLLACFAVVRADPPATTAAAFGWTLAAGAMGALGVHLRPDAVGSVAGLGFYVGWSAGWRRALAFGVAAVVTGALLVVRAGDAYDSPTHTTPAPYAAAFVAAALLGYALRRWMPPGVPSTATALETPGALPLASAHRMIGVLFFLALMGVPTVVASKTGNERLVNLWGFILIPSSLAACLMSTSALPRFPFPRRSGPQR